MSDPLAVELAKYEKDRAKAEAEAAKDQRAILELKRLEKSDRREFFGAILIGLAFVAVLTVVIGAVWHNSISTKERQVRIAEEKTEQQRLCLSLENPTERQLCFAINQTEERDK